MKHKISTRLGGRNVITETAFTIAATLVLVGGCGSSKPDAAPSPTPRAPTSVSADLASAITARLNAQDGPLVSSSGSAQIQTAADVRSDSAGAEHAADTLDAAGREDLTTKVGNHGIRVVFHFPTAAKAMANYRAATHDLAGSTAAFTIPGVPDSSAGDDSSCGCRTVDFVIGEYEYRLGLSTDEGDSPTRSQFIAMTQAWYANLKKLE